MRRLFIATCTLCLTATSLVGQERVITRPPEATIGKSYQADQRGLPLVSDHTPTLVQPSSAFPTLSTSTRTTESSQPDAAAADNQLFGSAVTVTSSLAVVLGLFAGLVWITRKYGSRTIGGGALPREALQSLGSTAIDPRTRVTMLRCGTRILVVAQTQTGIQPLSEITDPEEVRQLTAACNPDSKQSFSSTIHALEKEPVEQGFVGGSTNTPPPRRRLFASA